MPTRYATKGVGPRGLVLGGYDSVPDILALTRHAPPHPPWKTPALQAYSQV